MNPVPLGEEDPHLDREFPAQVWFAWYPVWMRDGRIAWLRFVLRQLDGLGLTPYLRFPLRLYNYRPIPPGFAGLERTPDGRYRATSPVPPDDGREQGRLTP